MSTTKLATDISTIVSQEKLAAKRAKLESEQIILTARRTKEEQSAELHVLNADKAITELKMTEIKLGSFDLLNVPQRDLNPKQASERYKAQALIKSYEGRILSIRSKIIEVNNPEYFTDTTEECNCEKCECTKEREEKQPIAPPETQQPVGSVSDSVTEQPEPEVKEEVKEPEPEPEVKEPKPELKPEVKEPEPTPVPQELPTTNQIIHITTKKGVIQAQETIQQMQLPGIYPEGYIQTYIINQELFDKDMAEFVQDKPLIQQHIGSLYESEIAPETRFMFIIEPPFQKEEPTPEPTPTEEPATPSNESDEEYKGLTRKAISETIRRYNKADALQKNTAETTLLNTVRESLITECPEDESILINSTIDYNINDELLYIAAIGNDAEGQFIVHSTTYDQEGSSEQVFYKLYKRQSAAEKYMRKFLGK